MVFCAGLTFDYWIDYWQIMTWFEEVEVEERIVG